jgi:hypothetical protein
MVDHEVAHVYTRDEAATRRAREVLAALARGGPRAGRRTAQAEFGLDHRRSGDLVLLAAPARGSPIRGGPTARRRPISPPTWTSTTSPATTRANYFFGWPPISVSLNTAKVGGTHGRADESSAIAWATSLQPGITPRTFLDLATLVRDWCER